MDSRLFPFFSLLVLGACSKASEPVVSNVSITPTSVSLGVGASTVLVGSARDASLNPVNATITWRSSASNVASITADGLLTGVAAGTTTITATAGGVPGTATVTVTSGPSMNAVVTMPGLSFVPADVRIALGGTVTFQFPSLNHNVIFTRSQPGAPADIQTTQNVNVTRTFPTAGSFPYDCLLHPGMSARIVVVP